MIENPTKIVATHTSQSGKTFEVHDRTEFTKAVMITRDANGVEIDRVRANTRAHWEDDELAGLYRAAVRLNP